MSLKEYRRKRNFEHSNEPRGEHLPKKSKELRFVIHKHDASRLHYDLRLELDGALKSWAVPKGPSRNPHDRRLAVMVEDHPLDYADFEGQIPDGQYGAGTVMIWDEGTYQERSNPTDASKAINKALKKGHLTFLLHGRRLQGEFALIQLQNSKKNWLLVKKHDTHARTKEQLAENTSVRSGLTMAAIKQKSITSTPLPPSNPQPPPPPVLARPLLDQTYLDDPLWISHTWHPGKRSSLFLIPGTPAKFYNRQGQAHRQNPSLQIESSQELIICDGIITEDTFWVYDLLFFATDDLRQLPLSDRLNKLKEISSSLPHPCQIPPGNPDQSQQILFRKLDAKYQAGINSHWRLTPQAKKAPSHSHKFADYQGPCHLSHPERIYWPEEGYRKIDLAAYYYEIQDFILPCLAARPLSLHRHPKGIYGPNFFHKDQKNYLPPYVDTAIIQSSKKTLRYLCCNNADTLVYLVQQSNIELNPWFAQADKPDHPLWGVIDLDPASKNPFSLVVTIANAIHRLLDHLEVPNYCKTSGATGLHIGIPLNQGRYTFDEVREFCLKVCTQIAQRYPDTTLERNPGRRHQQMYLDCYQNRRSQTLASPYCVRPRPGAPVSTPLLWEEVNQDLDPKSFNLATIRSRLAEVGDLWQAMHHRDSDLESAEKKLLATSPQTLDAILGS